MYFLIEAAKSIGSINVYYFLLNINKIYRIDFIISVYLIKLNGK